MDSIFIAKAEQELSRQDPVLGTLVRSQKLTLRSERGDYFTSLCRSIIGQQVSVAAAAAIFARLEIQTDMSPLRVASLNDEAVKIIGLSRQKAGYLRDLAQHFVGDPAIYNTSINRVTNRSLASLPTSKVLAFGQHRCF